MANPTIVAALIGLGGTLVGALMGVVGGWYIASRQTRVRELTYIVGESEDYSQVLKRLPRQIVDAMIEGIRVTDLHRTKVTIASTGNEEISKLAFRVYSSPDSLKLFVELAEDSKHLAKSVSFDSDPEMFETNSVVKVEFLNPGEILTFDVFTDRQAKLRLDYRQMGVRLVEKTEPAKFLGYLQVSVALTSGIAASASTAAMGPSVSAVIQWLARLIR